MKRKRKAQRKLSLGFMEGVKGKESSNNGELFWWGKKVRRK